MHRKLMAEAIGTFTLVFAGTGAIVVNDVSGGKVTHVGIALTFGLVVMVMAYALGRVSGAHLNPAVTLAMAAAGRLESRCMVPYMLAQIVGAFAASLLMRALFQGHAGLGTTLPAGEAWVSAVLEFLLTFWLVLVILGTTSGGGTPLAGAAIGGTIGLEALFAGPITGASMNPARSLAPAIVSGQTEHLWLYLVAPMLGGLLGVLAWRAMSPEERARVG